MLYTEHNGFINKLNYFIVFNNVIGHKTKENSSSLHKLACKRINHPRSISDIYVSWLAPFVNPTYIGALELLFQSNTKHDIYTKKPNQKYKMYKGINWTFLYWSITFYNKSHSMSHPLHSHHNVITHKFHFRKQTHTIRTMQHRFKLAFPKAPFSWS